MHLHAYISQWEKQISYSTISHHIVNLRDIPMNLIGFDRLICCIYAERKNIWPQISYYGTRCCLCSNGYAAHPLLLEFMTQLHPVCYIHIMACRVVFIWSITPWKSERIGQQENVHHRCSTCDDSKYKGDIFYNKVLLKKSCSGWNT